jgi:hypothetical protein
MDMTNIAAIKSLARTVWDDLPPTSQEALRGATRSTNSRTGWSIYTSSRVLKRLTADGLVVRAVFGFPEVTPAGILVREAGLMARESDAGATVDLA